jgi:hypothetical protein
MPTRGTVARRVRGISGPLWAKYDIACREVNGSTDRSADIRRHVEAVVAEWEQRQESTCPAAAEVSGT